MKGIAVKLILVSLLSVSQIYAKTVKYISVGAGQTQFEDQTHTTVNISLNANYYLFNKVIVLGFRPEADFSVNDSSFFEIGVLAKAGAHIEKVNLDVYAHASISAIDYTLIDKPSTLVGVPYGVGIGWRYKWAAVDIMYSTATMQDKYILGGVNYTKTTLSFGYSY